MKQTIAVILIGIFLLSLSGCGEDDKRRTNEPDLSQNSEFGAAVLETENTVSKPPLSNTTQEDKRELTEKYYDYSLKNPMIFLFDDYSNGFDDSCIAEFTLLKLIGYIEDGYTEKEFNDIANKYFRKTLLDFNTDKTYQDPQTLRIFLNGGDMAQMHLVLKDLSTNPNGEATAIFYGLHYAMGDEWPDAAQVKADLLSGNFEGYGKVFTGKLVFAEETDDSGEMYLRFISASDMVETNEKISVYGIDK